MLVSSYFRPSDYRTMLRIQDRPRYKCTNISYWNFLCGRNLLGVGNMRPVSHFRTQEDAHILAPPKN